MPSVRPVVFLAVLLLVGASGRFVSAQTVYTITDLGSLGGNSFAYGVNDHGDVVGESQLAGNVVHRAVLWRNGTMIDLGTLTPVHDSAIAWDVNNRRQVVGESMTGVDQNQGLPFVWDDGVMTALPLLPGHRSGYAWA